MQSLFPICSSHSLHSSPHTEITPAASFSKIPHFIIFDVCFSPERLIRNAEFEQPDASIAAVDYGHNRKINRHLIERLATCEYITEYRNIFITGATGSGKTYLACAFGMEACKRYYSVKYVRVPDLLLDLQEARDDGRFKEALKKYTNPALLILDEWLLMRVTEKDSANLLELIHKRRKHSSTIFCS